MIRYRVINGNTTIEFINYEDALSFKNDNPNFIIEEFEYLDVIQDNRKIVPQETTSWRIRAIVSLLGLETQVEQLLESLEEPNKTIAKYAWYQGSTVQRNSPTVLFIGQSLGLNNDEIDQIFIDAYNISV